jgi:1,4-alpha-glucan branching enzyme
VKRQAYLLSFLLLATSASAAVEIAATFSYTDPDATSVEVAGEFTNWKTMPMTKDTAGTWTKTFPLKPGQYGYKFIVDGVWKLDPKNPSRKLVNDIEDSAITVGNVTPPTPVAGTESVTLTFLDAQAKTVHVAGDFNQWLDNVDGKVTGKSEWLMQSDGAGKWKFVVTQPPGHYKFKYAIDGGERWSQDPNYPVSSDGNSILEIEAPGTTTGTPFTYADPAAKAVFIAGQFNNWSPTANPLKKNETGIWTVTIPLKAGKQAYKFVVDGDWRVDPKNPDVVDDADGNKNSVKTVAPN